MTTLSPRLQNGPTPVACTRHAGRQVWVKWSVRPPFLSISKCRYAQRFVADPEARCTLGGGNNWEGPRERVASRLLSYFLTKIQPSSLQCLLPSTLRGSVGLGSLVCHRA